MKCGERALSLISLTFGLVAAGALALAVATDFWLFTIEPIVPSENETLSDPGASILETVTIDDLDMESEVDEEAVTMIDQNGPLIVHMHSGLWRACIIYHGEHCILYISCHACGVIYLNLPTSRGAWMH